MAPGRTVTQTPRRSLCGSALLEKPPYRRRAARSVISSPPSSLLSTRPAAPLARYPVPRPLRAARGPETKPGPYTGDRRPLAPHHRGPVPAAASFLPRSPARPHLPRDKGRAATGSPRPRPPLPRPLLSRPRPLFRATRAGASANRKRRSGALGRPLANGKR